MPLSVNIFLFMKPCRYKIWCTSTAWWQHTLKFRAALVVSSWTGQIQLDCGHDFAPNQQHITVRWGLQSFRVARLLHSRILDSVQDWTFNVLNYLNPSNLLLMINFTSSLLIFIQVHLLPMIKFTSLVLIFIKKGQSKTQWN